MNFFRLKLTLQTENKRKQKDKQILEFYQKTEKAEEQEGFGDCNWWAWNTSQGIWKKAEGIGYQRKNGDHRDYTIVKISLNTQKSLWDLKKLAITPVKRWYEKLAIMIIKIIIIIIIIISARQKKKTCWIVDFAVPADHRVNLKESEKRNKYLDFPRKLKNLWNMKAMVIPIVNDADDKGLVQGL